MYEKPNLKAEILNPLKQQQYANAAKFNARIQLHAKCATNKYPWPLWVFDQLEKKANLKILELGCGTGMLWQVNGAHIPLDWEITVSDYSEGMLNETRHNLQMLQTKIRYELINAESIGFPDDSFDMIIANHMLYHIPNLDKALSEIVRVLKSNGAFYATTIGLNNMYEMKQLLRGFLKNSSYEEVLGTVENNFSLDNGWDCLEKYFQVIKINKYENSLNITESHLLVDYVLSCNGLKPGVEVLPISRVEEFRSYIENLLKINERIEVTTESGIFICKN